MDKKLTYLKEKQINKKAKENLENILLNNYAQNPIEAKFSAFKKAKKEIDIKDLF